MADHERIGTALSSIDACMLATRSVIEQLSMVQRGLTTHLLTSGTGHRAVKESPIGRIPEEWDTKSLGEIVTLTSGRAKPREASSLRSPSHSIPIYGGSGIVGYAGNFLRKGITIVIGRVGGHCGALHFVSEDASWITDSALFIYENEPEVDLRYLFYALRKLDFSRLRNAGRQAVISLAMLYPLVVPMPSIGEQREIASMLCSFESLIEIENRNHSQLRKMKTELEGDLVRG